MAANTDSNAVQGLSTDQYDDLLANENFQKTFVMVSSQSKASRFAFTAGALKAYVDYDFGTDPHAQVFEVLAYLLSTDGGQAVLQDIRHETDLTKSLTQGATEPMKTDSISILLKHAANAPVKADTTTDQTEIMPRMPPSERKGAQLPTVSKGGNAGTLLRNRGTTSEHIAHQGTTRSRSCEQ